MRAEFQELLGLTEAPPVILPPQGEDIVPLVEQVLRQGSRPALAMFEGYILKAEREGRSRDARLAELFRENNVPVVLSTPDASDAWNGKPYFRHRIEKILGRGALPRGKVFERTSDAEIVRYVTDLFAEGEQRVIVKVHGANGRGNLLLEPGDDLETRIGDFVKNPWDRESRWALVEAWRCWEHTYCCSYFINAENTLPIPLETCEQLLAPETAGFIGSRSFTDVSAKDLGIVQGALLPAVRAMGEDGIRGFVGIDVILVEPRPSDVLVLPDSGLGVLLVEANARINGHLQERLFAGYLAQREGLDLDDVLHLRVGNKPVESAEDRAGSAAFFTENLKGLAQPLTPRPMQEGKVYFVLDENNGQHPSNDGILFVARSGPGAEEAIMNAQDHLQEGGHLES